MRSIVIGLVAPKRAGKQTFVTLLLRALDRNFWSPSHGHYEFSAPLGLGLEKLGLPKTRQNYQNLAVVVNDCQEGGSLEAAVAKLGLTRTESNYQNMFSVIGGIFGNGRVVQGMELMLERSDCELKFADGVRWPEDETLIRGFPYNLMVYITASPEVRFERALKAANAKVGEKQMSWEEFQETERAKTELNIADIGSRADFGILNNGGLEEYERQVKIFYNLQLVPMIMKMRDKGD